MTEDHLASCCHHCRSLHQQGLNSNQASHADTQLSLGATGPPRCLCALKLKNIVSKTTRVFLPPYFRLYRNVLSRHEPAEASPRDPSHVLHSITKNIHPTVVQQPERRWLLLDFIENFPIFWGVGWGVFIFCSGINSGSQLESDFRYNKVRRGDLH